MEIPETQTGLLSQVHGVNVWVPETEPLLCSANRCEHHFKDSEDIEILETQLESTNSKQKVKQK